MGRGSIGDVTFYRADGQQLARVRNRRPKNPKTEAQLYQRAIMATVVKAYQAGKTIFDHSFQGFSVGAACQRQFMSLNSKMLRQLVATDINTPIPTNSQKARVVAPGVSAPVANPFIISRGSYQQNLFTYNATSHAFEMPHAAAEETVAAYAQRIGLIAGDIYTIIVFAERKGIAYQSPKWDDALACVNYCDFGWIRMIVKSGLSNDTSRFESLVQLFKFETSGGSFEKAVNEIGGLASDDVINMAAILGDNASNYTLTGALGMIRSRLDQDLRSDSELYVNYGTTADDMFGITSDYILDEWINSTTNVGNSELILEGGNG